MKQTVRILVTGQYCQTLKEFGTFGGCLTLYITSLQLHIIEIYYSSNLREKTATEGGRPAPAGKIERGRSCDSPRATANSGNRR